MQPRCAQQPGYAYTTPTGNIPEAPEIGTPRYSGVPLYTDPKPTSVRNKPHYLSTAAHHVWVFLLAPGAPKS